MFVASESDPGVSGSTKATLMPWDQKPHISFCGTLPFTEILGPDRNDVTLLQHIMCVIIHLWVPSESMTELSLSISIQASISSHYARYHSICEEGVIMVAMATSVYPEVCS